MTFTSLSTGGEYKHLLTYNEMPEHDHYISGYSSAFGTKYYYNLMGGSNSYGYKETGVAGKNEFHNNIPPYIVTYFWKRIS